MKNAPDLIRGQLAQPAEDYAAGMSRFLARLLAGCRFAFLNKPDFIAYKIGPLPFTVKLARLLGAVNVRWTSHSEDDAKDADMVIFEHYRPPLKIG